MFLSNAKGRNWFCVLSLCATSSVLFVAFLRLSPSSSPSVGYETGVLAPAPNGCKNGSLIDLRGFRFVVNDAYRCSTDVGRPPYVVILVHSAPGHWDKRRSIRDTWGNETFWQEKFGRIARIVFLLGMRRQNAAVFQLQKRIELEQAEHGDIVQGNFEDTYRNLTYKHVMGLLWVRNHCPDAHHVLKVDDDVFVEPFQLNDFLIGAAPSRIFCSVCHKCFVKRGYRTKKWRVSFREYPHRYFPDFCAGIGVITDPSVMSKLYEASCRTQFFWIDDVHVTGILAEAAGVPRVDMGARVTISEELVEEWLAAEGNARLLPVMIAHSKHFDDIVYAAWNKTKLGHRHRA